MVALKERLKVLNEMGLKVSFCKVNPKVLLKMQCMGITGEGMTRDTMEVLE